MAHNHLLTPAQFDHEEMNNIFKPFKPTKHKLFIQKWSPKTFSNYDSTEHNEGIHKKSWNKYLKIFKYHEKFQASLKIMWNFCLANGNNGIIQTTDWTAVLLNFENEIQWSPDVL